MLTGHGDFDQGGHVGQFCMESHIRNLKCKGFVRCVLEGLSDGDTYGDHNWSVHAKPIARPSQSQIFL